MMMKIMCNSVEFSSFFPVLESAAESPFVCRASRHDIPPLYICLKQNNKKNKKKNIIVNALCVRVKEATIGRKS